MQRLIDTAPLHLVRQRGRAHHECRNDDRIHIGVGDWSVAGTYAGENERMMGVERA